MPNPIIPGAGVDGGAGIRLRGGKVILDASGRPYANYASTNCGCCNCLSLSCTRCAGGVAPDRYTVTFSGISVFTDCIDSCVATRSIRFDSGTVNGTFCMTSALGINCSWQAGLSGGIPPTNVIATGYSAAFGCTGASSSTEAQVFITHDPVAPGPTQLRFRFVFGATHAYLFDGFITMPLDCASEMTFTNLITSAGVCYDAFGPGTLAVAMGSGGTATVTACC